MKGLELLKKLTKTRIVQNSLMGAAVGYLSGGSSSFVTSGAGYREKAAKEGKVIGLSTGLAAGAAIGIGSIVFRKVRGRIIPIRIKK